MRLAKGRVRHAAAPYADSRRDKMPLADFDRSIQN